MLHGGEGGSEVVENSNGVTTEQGVLQYGFIYVDQIGNHGATADEATLVFGYQSAQGGLYGQPGSAGNQTIVSVSDVQRA